MIKILVQCDGCEREHVEEATVISVDELDDYGSADLSNDIECSVDSDEDWGVYWDEEEDEHKIYCPTCKAYKVK